jgi:hypothetical protein
MSQEDEALLRAVRDWRPPTTLHPIAMFAWNLYEGSGMSLPPEAVQTLRARLDALRDNLIALAEHLEGLTRFMIYVGEMKGDVASGQKIAELMRDYSALFEPFWQRVGEALKNVESDSLDNFRRFTGQHVEEKKVTAHDAEAPRGTVPLKAFTPPARPPPWARKKNIASK